MRKLSIIFFTLYFYSTTLFSMVSIADEGRVGNGSGEAERNIAFAMGRMDKTLTHLIGRPTIFTIEEYKILESLSANLLPTAQRLEQLHFSSEKEKPGFFSINGNLKVAKTWTDRGAPIFFNTDLLYTKDYQGDIIPYSIAQATSLLIHELGHQVGIVDCHMLDRLATKVELEMREQMQELKFNLGSHRITVSYTGYVDQEKKQQSIFTVASSDHLIDLTDYLYQQIKCPSQVLNELVSLKLENIHRTLNFTSTENELTQSIELWARIRCQGESGQSFASYQQVQLKLTMQKRDNFLVFDKDKIELQQNPL